MSDNDEMENPRVYLERGKVAHLLPASTSPNDGYPAVCGRRPWRNWFGTGTYDESIRAHTLPLCTNCAEIVGVE